MSKFATIEDIENLWRPLRESEKDRAEALLEIISDSLREEAFKVGKDIDEISEKRPSYKSVLKSVVVDVVARTLLTSTEDEPMTQYSQSAMGYSVSGTFLVPGGGLFIKKSELKRLGLTRQKFGTMEIYGDYKEPRLGGYYEED